LDLNEFLLTLLPPPARLLEVGCGDGSLAHALSRAGYDVTAIDPRAPDGASFRRVTLEEFTDDGVFDAVVASVSLHHVHELAVGLDRLDAVLRPGGLLVVEEFAKEQLVGATARWYYHERLALAALGRDDAPRPDGFEAWLAAWHEEHEHIHPWSELRGELDVRFDPRHTDWTPYLFDYRLDDALEPLERALLASGELEPTGWRYVGVRRPMIGS
jgi:SAM-dependent methyltransferase